MHQPAALGVDGLGEVAAVVGPPRLLPGEGRHHHGAGEQHEVVQLGSREGAARPQSRRIGHAHQRFGRPTQGLGAANDPGIGHHRHLEVVAQLLGGSSVGSRGPGSSTATSSTPMQGVLTARVRFQHRPHGSGGRGPSPPPTIASTTRGPKTMPSSSEFDASRSARGHPCR